MATSETKEDDEPAPETTPYSTPNNDEYASLPSNTAASAASPLIHKNKSDDISEGHIQIDLNERGTRLTLWSIAYFIFSIAEFSGNAIIADNTLSSKLKSAYQTWAASDFFLLLGASLLFIECNPKYILNDIGISSGDELHKIIGYICSGLFGFGGFLRWIALGKHNDVMCNGSYCNSWHFAQDYMATWFSFVIALDILDISQRIDVNQRALRMIVYASLMILDGIIVFSHYGHTSSEYGSNSYLNAAQTGWFFVWFLLIIILVIAILIILNKYDGLMSSDTTKKYVHFGIAVALNIAVGLAYYSGALLFQTWLGIVAMQMIIYDLMCSP